MGGGGMLIWAWRGVSSVTATALGAHHSASGSGSTTTIADPGAIPVDAGALAFGVTMSNRVAGLAAPLGFANVNEGEDPAMKGDAESLVFTNAGTADPQWTWLFDATTGPGTWLATVLAPNPAATHPALPVQPTTTLAFMTLRPPGQA